jgi:Protein of unknown function (DUF4232)
MPTILPSPASSASPGGPVRPGLARASGRRAVPLAVTAVATAGLLVSCASTSMRLATGDAATESGRTPNAAMSSASAGGMPAASGTAGLAVCQPAALRVTINANAAGGAAGSTYYPVDFTNTAGSACGMDGYPGVSLVTAGDNAGRPIGAAAQRNPAFGQQPVRLAAGGVAHAWLQVAQAGNYPPSACKPVTAHWLRVFVPGQAVALYVNHAFDACSSASDPLLTVMPVRAGQGVQGTTP